MGLLSYGTGQKDSYHCKYDEVDQAVRYEIV